MPFPLLAVLLPALYWDQPAGTADALHKAGIETIYVPAARVDEWRKAGLSAAPFDRSGATAAVVPKVEYHMDVASATRVPWIDANGWQFERAPAKSYFYDVPKGRAALAAAEAFVYGVDAAIRAVPEDLDSLAQMLHFLNAIGKPGGEVRANLGLIDDGSDLMGEVMNLLARHNLLFHVIPQADPKYDLNISLGPGGYTKEQAANPYEFAMQIRRRLTDEKRLVRIYGSNVVIVRLTGDRVHLLNYGDAAVRGLRVRVRGTYRKASLAASGFPGAEVADFAAEDDATEFTVPQLGAYAAVSLSR